MKPNSSTQLEEQIQSWKPRRPSSGLQHRIFGADAETEPTLNWPRWGWLAPAASLCVVVVQLAVYHPVTGISATALSPATLAAASLGDRDLSAYTPGWVHSAQNGPIRDTFEWTNRTAALSTVRTLPVILSMTNSLFD